MDNIANILVLWARGGCDFYREQACCGIVCLLGVSGLSCGEYINRGSFAVMNEGTFPTNSLRSA
jgi:hypothetical protein